MAVTTWTTVGPSLRATALTAESWRPFPPGIEAALLDARLPKSEGPGPGSLTPSLENSWPKSTVKPCHPGGAGARAPSLTRPPARGDDAIHGSGPRSPHRHVPCASRRGLALDSPTRPSPRRAGGPPMPRCAPTHRSPCPRSESAQRTVNCRSLSPGRASPPVARVFPPSARGGCAGGPDCSGPAGVDGSLPYHHVRASRIASEAPGG